MNKVIERDLPNSPGDEIIVLGKLVEYPEYLEDVMEDLRPTDFYSNRHRVLYEAMLNYYHEYGEAPNYMTLLQKLTGNKDISSDELVDIVRKSHEEPSYNLEQSMNTVIGTSVQRTNIHASQKLAMIGYNVVDPDKARLQVEKLLYDLTTSQVSSSDFEILGDILARCMNKAEMASKNRGRMTGLATHYTDLDLMTGGLQPADFILLAARPSMGKTSLAINIGYNVAKNGGMVAAFSLEMPKEQLGLRLLSHVSRIPANDIRSGWLEQDQWDTLVEAKDHLDNLHFYIDDASGSPVSAIRSKLRRLKAKTHRNPDLVILDYVGLMESEEGSTSRKENRNQEISEISRGLKGIAREFDVPMLVLAQLSRAVEGRSSKIPQLSDLRDSGSLEQDADVVMFVYRDEYYAGFNADGSSKSDRPGTGDIVVAKHRNGPIGEFRLKFNGPLTRFDNLDEMSEEPEEVTVFEEEPEFEGEEYDYDNN